VLVVFTIARRVRRRKPFSLGAANIHQRVDWMAAWRGLAQGGGAVLRIKLLLVVVSVFLTASCVSEGGGEKCNPNFDAECVCFQLDTERSCDPSGACMDRQVRNVCEDLDFERDTCICEAYRESCLSCS